MEYKLQEKESKRMWMFIRKKRKKKEIKKEAKIKRKKERKKEKVSFKKGNGI